MTIFLYRANVSLTSGAGRLMRTQAEGLRAAGEDVRIACRRGGLRFWLDTRLPVSRASALRGQTRFPSAVGDIIVDHGMELPHASVVFVHNLLTAAVLHLPHAGKERAEGERQFFQELRPQARIVANSQLVKYGLVEHLGIEPQRIVVHYPGVDARCLGALDREALRTRARQTLRVAADAPLIGFVTSGDFEKRGLDIFIEAAERIAAARADARFLIVGSKTLPQWAARHALVTRGHLLHRPKSKRPERWFAALDLFLYPAHFEEFGMVVSEAQAIGLPVLTSRRVGAAERLPEEYTPWLLEAPEASAFAEKALALLDDPQARSQLIAAGRSNIPELDREHYARASMRTILEAKARG